MASEASDATFDSVHESTMLKSVDSLGEKSATTVRIFNKNDYYYLFEEDGQLCAKHVNGSVTAMKQMGKKNPKNFAVVNHNQFEDLLRHILLVKHYRVEVYKWFMAKGGQPAKYELEVRASPGNIAAVEHLLYGENEQVKDTNYLVGVKLNPSGKSGEFSLGVAAVDTSLKLIRVCDIVDTESFSNLEAILVQLSPREVILPQSDNSMVKKIQEVVERNRLLVTSRTTKEFSPLEEGQVKRNINPKSNTECIKELPLASGALNAVLSYLGVTSDSDSSKEYRLEELKHSEYMRIDARTVTGLNLFDLPGQPIASVYSILNKTRTPGGSRLLQSWIKQPLLDVDKINERLDLVELLTNSTEIRQTLFEDHLRKMPDFQRLSSKFQAKKATLQEMYKVHVALNKLGDLNGCLEAYDGDKSTMLKENFVKDIAEALKDFDKYSQMVETTIDIKTIETSGQFLIKPDFDDELGELRGQLDQVEEKLRKCLNQCAKELGLDADKTIKLEYSSHQGHYLRVTMKDEKNLRGNKAYIILDSSKSGVKFRNNKMEALNDEHGDLTKRYELQQESIVQEIVGISAGYADPMNHLGQVISRLDVLVALAVTAVSAPTPYCRPIVEPSGSGQMSFTQLRHPIIEIQDHVNFIPNDVTFSKDSTYFQIITGPNMGGKSTYIRSVGTAVIMAQVGSFVPADTATIQVVDSVMVRIGASDCQVKGISTFMAEMLETSSILQTATSNSLVLIDELGRGTSTYDGFGLAWAVSEHIAKVVKCFTLFTTHYTELTSLADKVAGVKNYHVSAICNQDKLTLLYEVQPGVCDKSFGLHVARLACFPESVVKEANDRVALLEDAGKMENMKDEEKRQTIEEGETILETFFDQAKDLDKITNESELIEKFEKLKKETLNTNNAYIQSLVTAGTS